MCFNKKQADQDKKKTDGINQKAGGCAEFRHDNAGDGRTDDSGGIKCHGIQSHRIRQIFFLLDKLINEWLSAGGIKGVENPVNER